MSVFTSRSQVGAGLQRILRATIHMLAIKRYHPAYIRLIHLVDPAPRGSSDRVIHVLPWHNGHLYHAIALALRHAGIRLLEHSHTCLVAQIRSIVDNHTSVLERVDQVRNRYLALEDSISRRLVVVVT